MVLKNDKEIKDILNRELNLKDLVLIRGRRGYIKFGIITEKSIRFEDGGSIALDSTSAYLIKNYSYKEYVIKNILLNRYFKEKNPVKTFKIGDVVKNFLDGRKSYKITNFYNGLLVLNDDWNNYYNPNEFVLVEEN